MKKIIVTALALIFLISFSNAFGSFPYERVKNLDSLESTYRLGFFNPGEQDLRVDLSEAESSNYSLDFSRESFVIPGNVTTSNPEGEGWYPVGEGIYAPVEQVEVSLEVSKYRNSNRIKIPVTITASPKANSSGTAKLTQVREILLEARLERSLVPLDRETGEEDEPDFWREASNTAQDESESFNGSSEDNLTGEEGEKTGNTSMIKGKRNNSEKDRGQVNGLTYIFLTGIALSIFYIFGVV